MAIAALLVALVVLPLILARDSIRDRRRRGDWFAPVLPLLDAYRVTQDGKGWPVLTGRYRGQEVRLEPDYCGFTIPDAFVVGYGLDFNDDHRHLPHVAVLDEPGP